MNSSAKTPRFSAFLFYLAVTASFILLPQSILNAQITNFAQFFEINGTKDFRFTNNTTSGNFTAVSGGSPVFFLYQNITGLPLELQGVQLAHLTVTSTTDQSGLIDGSNNVNQPLNNTTLIRITRDTPASQGVGSRTDLLTILFGPIGATQTAIIGGNGGSAFTISASTPTHGVAFGSDFLNFSSTINRSSALSFTAATPPVALGAGNFLQTLQAAGSGTFASDPVPTFTTPTAANVSLSGRVLTSGGFGLRRASVVLTTSDGTVYSASTNSFGAFRIDNVPSGQTVIVSVRAKQHIFQPKVIILADDITDLEITESP